MDRNVENHSEQDRAEAQAWEACIVEACDLHCMPPAGLGKMAMSVHHKLMALLHQIRLCLPSHAALAEFLCGTVSITTDQGTESKLIDVPRLDLSSVFWAKGPGLIYFYIYTSTCVAAESSRSRSAQNIWNHIKELGAT